jgi:hypothetical protein
MPPPMPGRCCPGTLSRRSFLHAGLAGAGGLGLADLLRLEARAAGDSAGQKSMVVLWLWGGPSPMETFDLEELFSQLPPACRASTAGHSWKWRLSWRDAIAI